MMSDDHDWEMEADDELCRDLFGENEADERLPWTRSKCQAKTTRPWGNLLVCTRPAGHHGPHEAHGTPGEIFKRWENDKEKP